MVLGIVTLPSVALANAGTPLMWAGMLHLVFGNLVIGLLEGNLLAKFFGLPKGKTVGIVILANYFSAWLGGLFLRGAIVRAFPLDLNNAWLFFWAMVGLTCLITLALEFPFVALAFRRDPQWLRNSIFDPAAKQVALVTKGRGPIAVMEEERSNQAPEDTARKLADPQR
jgi:hypothetical protein